MKTSPVKICKLLSDESFLRWLSGKASQEENEKWNRWLSEAGENQQLYKNARTLWEKTRFRSTSTPNTEEALQKLRNRLNLNALTSSSAQPRVSYRIDRHIGTWYKKRWLQLGFGIAAAVLFLVFVWQYSNIRKAEEYLTLTTQFGEQQLINLPDGSKIVLNANSTIRYPQSWNSNTKRHFFLKGEAYFEVTSQPEGPQHEFLVFTSDGLVRVLGTAFVVYDRGAGTRVVVEKGRVAVLSKALDRSKDYVATVQLVPGNMVLFHRGDKSLHPYSGAVNSYISWWKDSFVLNQTSFGEIVQRLEETYGVPIEVRDKRALNRVLSGSIENHDLNIILQTLSEILQLPVSRQDSVIVFGAK